MRGAPPEQRRCKVRGSCSHADVRRGTSGQSCGEGRLSDRAVAGTCSCPSKWKELAAAARFGPVTAVLSLFAAAAHLNCRRQPEGGEVSGCPRCATAAASAAAEPSPLPFSSACFRAIAASCLIRCLHGGRERVARAQLQPTRIEAAPGFRCPQGSGSTPAAAPLPTRKENGELNRVASSQCSQKAFSLKKIVAARKTVVGEVNPAANLAYVWLRRPWRPGRREGEGEGGRAGSRGGGRGGDTVTRPPLRGTTCRRR